MREWTGKKYWLVGASEGLGRALAHQLSRVGTELVLSARTESRLADLAAALPGRGHVAPCDVTDPASVREAARAAGEVDGVVYLAGAYWPMSATDWDTEKAATMCDVNLAGCLRVLGETVPGMVSRRRGHVVLAGGIAGLRGMPDSIGYGAAKAGIINLAESMYADLSGTGVEVQLVNPGHIRTRLGERAPHSGMAPMEPDMAAREVFEHMNGEALTRTFPRGAGAMLRLGKAMPDWLWYRVVGRG